MEKAEKVDRTLEKRELTLILLDCFAVNLSALGALLLRFELSIGTLAESGFVQAYLKTAPLYSLAAISLFMLCRLYRSLWQYASIDELRYIIIASCAATAAQIGISSLMGVYLPRSMPILNLMLLFLSLTLIRYSYRIARRYLRRSAAVRRRTMLIGAGAAGAMVMQELKRSPQSENDIVCVIDDDPGKKHTLLSGVKVVGGRECIEEAVAQYGVSDIIFAIPSASRSDTRKIIGICQHTGCKLQTLPGLYQLASGQISVKQIRNVRVEDLLGRDRVQTNLSEIGAYIRGKTVLVTGGGGSIGSELCRQIACQQPGRLIIFDIYENNAYTIQQELRYTHPELELVTLIGSVRDRARVEAVFAQYRPQIVCHAAAHKHVPLMEDSPNEAVKNNIFGTLNTARAADRYGAEAFVLISTDKAMNPTNVMGASKRVCEMIVQVMGQRSKTRFAAVRFGNVLGSNGSVIPLFKAQIEHGGPVTVTHRDIIRYFMTIPEAVSLVLQTCCYAKDGEVFVLDMGEPVRIDDLARNMIRLSGFEPDVDIPVVYTGLRPGEKLYEELLMNDEGLDKTENELIFIGHFNDFDRDTLLAQLEDLSEASSHNSSEIRALLQRIVPTYHPAEMHPPRSEAPEKQPAPEAAETRGREPVRIPAAAVGAIR